MIPPIIGETGISADFEDADFSSFELARSNAGGAGLEMATERADGVVGGIGGGGGIFFPVTGDWLEGALVLALASGELATVVPGTFAEGAFGSIEILGSLAGGALDPLEGSLAEGALDLVGEVVSVVILVVTSQVEDGPISYSWGGY